MEYDKHDSRDSHQILLNNRDQRLLITGKGPSLLSMIALLL